MIKRICPNCGAENYSADTLFTWICYKCGVKIPKTKNLPKRRAVDNVKRGSFKQVKDN